MLVERKETMPFSYGAFLEPSQPGTTPSITKVIKVTLENGSEMDVFVSAPFSDRKRFTEEVALAAIPAQLEYSPTLFIALDNV